MKPIKCAVFGLNSNGEPDIFFCKIKCSEEQYHNGDHYDKAKELAEENCYDAILACDEHDPAGKVVELFEWEKLDPSQIIQI